mmetsp:Transcript_5082/g.12387  ORF Transcript_5082/g.12387 Transcript_5082/m.12387 type:complete len:457 (+) Transcript_5082:221-1591(+)
MSGLRFSIPGFLSWSPTDSEQVEKTLSCDTVLKTQTWEDDLNDLSEDEAGASEAPSGLNVPDTQQVETCRPWKRALPSEARSDSRDDAIGIGLLQLPDSVIFRILTYLPCADICQVMQTSHAARELASSEAVWAQAYACHRAALLRLPGSAAGGGGRGPPSGTLSARHRHGQHAVLEARLRRMGSGGGGAPLPEERPTARGRGYCTPSLALARSMARACSIGQRFHGLRQAHDEVRCAMDACWSDPEAVQIGHMRRMVLKLTRFDWSLAYECVVAGFVHCADCVAASMCSALAAGRRSAGGDARPGAADLPAAAEAWRRLLRLWGRYRRWLLTVLSTCSDLNDMVSAERSAEYLTRGNQADTPTLFDRGKAAFRSQVMVRFELRPALQASLALLQDAGADPSAEARRMLLELDVPDDTTESPALFTRELFCRRFGLVHPEGRDACQRAGLGLRCPT